MNENISFANITKFNPLDKVCVVTGGSSGIGSSLISELNERKAKHIINLEIKNNNIKNADFFKCNVGENDDVKKSIEEIYQKYGSIDLFCCNAGIAKDDDGNASVEHWENVLKVNLLQHINIVRNSINKMLQKRNGWFLITASAAGLLSQVGSATYSTSKHAAVGFAEWLSITYGNKGIGVSLLCPQGVNTPMTSDIVDGGVAGINGMLEPEEVAKVCLDEMALEVFNNSS